MGLTIFTAGTKAKASEVNANFTDTRLHRKVYTSAAEETTTSTSFEDSSKTYTLSAPVNSLIIAVNFYAELKCSSTNVTSIGLKLVGSNLGTKYFNSTATYTAYSDQSITGMTLVDAESDPGGYKSPLVMKDTSYVACGNSSNKPIKVLDASTVFTLRKQTSANTGYLKNVSIEIVYATAFIED